MWHFFISLFFRLIRQVGHKLKKIGALSHPLRAEKNEDVVFSAHSLTRLEELLEECFSALENYTGQLTAHVSWQCPQSNPDIQLSGYKVLVDGKQYGSPMHSGVRTVKIQVPIFFSQMKILLKQICFVSIYIFSWLIIGEILILIFLLLRSKWDFMSKPFLSC